MSYFYLPLHFQTQWEAAGLTRWIKKMCLTKGTPYSCARARCSRRTGAAAETSLRSTSAWTIQTQNALRVPPSVQECARARVLLGAKLSLKVCVTGSGVRLGREGVFPLLAMKF